MNFTHAQILELTGMTQDRLRHWRKEIRGLDERASRSGVVTFEEVALLAVLSRATDELGLSVSLIAAHYEEVLLLFQENELVGEEDVVLWLALDAVTVSHINAPPVVNVCAMMRLAPIIEAVYNKLHPPTRRQLTLALNEDENE